MPGHNQIEHGEAGDAERQEHESEQEGHDGAWGGSQPWGGSQEAEVGAADCVVQLEGRADVVVGVGRQVEEGVLGGQAVGDSGGDGLGRGDGGGEGEVELAGRGEDIWHLGLHLHHHHGAVSGHVGMEVGEGDLLLQGEHLCGGLLAQEEGTRAAGDH